MVLAVRVTPELPSGEVAVLHLMTRMGRSVGKVCTLHALFVGVACKIQRKLNVNAYLIPHGRTDLPQCIHLRINARAIRPNR